MVGGALNDVMHMQQPRVVHSPSSPVASGGCMALAPHLRMVVWLRKFRPHLGEKYDGTINPAEFLQIYSTSILAARVNKAIVAKYFHVALADTARTWPMNLPERSITSWQELCLQFSVNFESAYSRPGNETDLLAIQQSLGETLCSFI
jgi:hypothetical protein